MASFELCLQQGCDGFEFDVRRSLDGVAVVCHDPAVSGMTVDRTPAASLDLPTLEDVLSKFAARAFLDIELKVPGLEESTVKSLREHSPKGYVVSSFLPEVLSAIHNLDPSVPLGFIFDDRHHLDNWRRLPIDWMIPHFELADEALVRLCQKAAKKVMVWTVNRESCLKKMSASGVNALISDETEVAARVLAHGEDAR